MLPWIGIERAYESTFRLMNGVLFSVLGFGYGIDFRPNPTEYSGDTLVSVLDPLTGHGWLVTCDSMIGFWPICVFVALVVATPMVWARKWRALRNGFVWLHVFIFARVGLILLEAYAMHPGGCRFEHEGWLVSPSMQRFFTRINQEVSLDLVVSLVPAVAVWLLVSFRREDWAALFGGDHRGRAKEPSDGRPAFAGEER